MQEAERCQINLITIKDGNMFLSSENSQKGVKNKAALKVNNFISPATQGENTIQFRGNILSHWCRHLLIFYFWKRKIGKIESKQNETLLSFLEKSFWLVYQFSKEFKNCFLLPPATSVIVSLTHFIRKKIKLILHFMLFFLFVRLSNHLYRTLSESIIRRNDLLYFPC